MHQDIYNEEGSISTKLWRESRKHDGRATSTKGR